MDEEKTMTQGEKIAALRKTKNMTQSELGEALNISFQAVSKWERDESAPDFDTISKIARLFNVPISFFERDSKQTIAEAIAATSETVSTEKEETVESKRLLGVCKDCGVAVYEGERGEVGYKFVKESNTYIPASPDEIVCKRCSRKRADGYRQYQEDLKKREENELAHVLKRRNSGLIWSIIFTAIFVGIGLLSKNYAGEYSNTVMISSLVSIPFAYAFFAQLFWDGAVVDCVLGIMSKSLRLPGIIFSFDLDGLKFLILMKLLFAVITFLFGVAMFFLGIIVGMFIAPFTFFPALHRMGRADGLN